MKKHIIKKRYGFLVIDGEYYQVDNNKQGAMVAIPQNKTHVMIKIERAKQMATKLRFSLDAEKVLTEALMINFTDKDFDKLYKQLFESKINYKPKTRVHHCVDMKVGNTIIPIVN